MMKNIFAAVLTIVLMITSVGCTTTNNIENEGMKTYVHNQGDFYIPIKNGEKVFVIHDELEWETGKTYLHYKIYIDGNKYIQQNVITNEETTYTFNSNIEEIRYVRERDDGPEYCYRTEKNEVGTICKDKTTVFENGGDNVKRALFYWNEQNKVKTIYEEEDYLIYYENSRLKGANINGSSFWFDNYSYEKYNFLGAHAIAVGKGIPECRFYAYCPNLNEDASIEELIADSGINY